MYIEAHDTCRHLIGRYACAPLGSLAAPICMILSLNRRVRAELADHQASLRDNLHAVKYM